MKTITVKLKIDPQKFDAAQQFMEEKGLDINEELGKAVEDFYKKYVPSAVRKYIEKSSAAPRLHTAEPSPAALNEPLKSASLEPGSSQNGLNLGSSGSNGL